jgi:hypothetical protein
MVSLFILGLEKETATAHLDRGSLFCTHRASPDRGDHGDAGCSDTWTLKRNESGPRELTSSGVLQ